MADLCMRLWVLQVNLWLLALVTGGISADKNNTSNSTGSVCPSVHQHPRYVAVKKNMPIYFICYSDNPKIMQWYKTAEDSENICGLDDNTPQYTINRTDTFINLTILSVTFEDSAIYVCDRKNVLEKKHLHTCGTQLQVLGHSSLKQIQNRNTLKDAIIIIQSILLVIFISIPILLLLDKGEGKKGPEEDHTYEGLEVEQMATYEDITPFRDVKAKWTVGEHPGEE
ncbi:PREDICTED: B-cell antigen receptor complex-associated protein beta chain [Lepidothrix coronata]|uniref:B-cell antigen receptor complex-associated protein beta chain n=1 Tax=Lepidothrix coronata TaxID=321398 RepID=A0A6J0J6N9_9PASS|nr:PREDICTED: B-cell antigen receptor complex-associated protein beta chain [Lepidothrix coronata]